MTSETSGCNSDLDKIKRNFFVLVFEYIFSCSLMFGQKDTLVKMHNTNDTMIKKRVMSAFGIEIVDLGFL